jgi:hypothetical protein
MHDVVANVQQSKAAYKQARRELAAYAQQHWIGRRATGVKTYYSLTTTIVSVTPGGRVHLLDCSVSFDIEEIQVLD